MDNEIQIFTNSEFGELEIWQDGDKFWFPASKCAEKLGYSNTRKAIADHCKVGGVTKRDTPYTVTNQFGEVATSVKTVNFIDEGNLYRLITHSKKPEAERFEAWIFDDVLPTIRKHGAYIMPELLEEIQHNTEKNAKLLQELAKEQKSRVLLEEKFNSLSADIKKLEKANNKYKNLVKTESDKNKALTGQIEDYKKANSRLNEKAAALSEKTEELSKKATALTKEFEEVKPKATYYDIIMVNTRAVPITLIAKDYGMSAIAMNQLLYSEGIQFPIGGTWALYKPYQDKNYTHNNVTKIPNGKHTTYMCWTQRGRKFIYEHLKAIGILPLIEKEA